MKYKKPRQKKPQKKKAESQEENPAAEQAGEETEVLINFSDNAKQKNCFYLGKKSLKKFLSSELLILDTDEPEL
jgi:hypothetical protein